MTVTATALVATTRTESSSRIEDNEFVVALERGAVARARLAELARTLHGLVRSDRRSFTLAATRFPDDAGELFLTLAHGEAEALALLDRFARTLGLTPTELRRHDPPPLTQGYPAFLSHVAQTGSRSDLALALLGNVERSGATYRRIADALVDRYRMDEDAVAHFRYLGDTPREILDQALEVLAQGLASGDDPAEARRVARTVDAFEHLFWHTMHEPS